MSDDKNDSVNVEGDWTASIRAANERMRGTRRIMIAPKVSSSIKEAHKEQLAALSGMTPKQAKANLEQEVKRTRGKKKRRSHYKRDAGSDFTKSIEWRRLRYAVLALFGRGCMCCGSKKGTVNVDHIQPRIKRPDLSLNLTNLQVLCEACNFGKGYRDNTDWRTEEQRVLARNVEDKSLVAILDGKR